MATNGIQDTTAPALPRIVDLGGDANLLVGPNGCQVRIRVCKALLCFASKYFNALFSGNFSESVFEGQGQDVPLEEDEPDAVVNLCKILHMKYTWPASMTPKELLHLAIVADKYDCVKALQLSVQSLFPRSKLTCDAWGVRDLIVASYLLDHPEWFQKYTKILIGSYTQPLSEIGLSEMGQRVPMAVWC